MAERLVVVSDMWGAKNGLWITSYLGYLQQYFNITFYDSRELAGIDKRINTAEGLYEAFVAGGMETAVKQLLNKESETSHYLTFCAGGTIAWDAGSKGLPVKSLYAVSPIDMEKQETQPGCPVTLIYGEVEEKLPDAEWIASSGVKLETIAGFGHELYNDEKIIQKVCLDLLDLVLTKPIQI